MSDFPFARLVLTIAALGSGIIGGTFFAFSTFVMASLGWVATDLAFQRQKIDEMVGLTAQIVGDHRRLRRHRRDDRNLAARRCSASTSVVKSPSPEKITR
jgi:hypothetical protein